MSSLHPNTHLCIACSWTPTNQQPHEYCTSILFTKYPLKVGLNEELEDLNSKPAERTTSTPVETSLAKIEQDRMEDISVERLEWTFEVEKELENSAICIVESLGNLESEETEADDVKDEDHADFKRQAKLQR